MTPGKPSKFDALANIYFVENEITPQTMTLKEDSFKEPQEGMDVDQWMTLPYRKRRYITLRNRARSGTAAPEPDVAEPSLKVPPADYEVPEAEPIEPELDTTDDEPEDEPEDTSEPFTNEPDNNDGDVDIDEPVGEEFIDAVVNAVTNNPGITREKISEFLGQNYGDRLNTQAHVNNVIRKAVQNGDIEFTPEDIAFIPGSESSPEKEPNIADLETPEAETARKKNERQRLIKKFLKWRQERAAGASSKGEESDEEQENEPEEDDESPLKKADTVIGKRNYNRISRAGIEDPESMDTDTD